MRKTAKQDAGKITKDSHPELRRTRTIGELEQLAGIEDRNAFWMKYAPLREQAFEAAVDDLREIAFARLTKGAPVAA
ncbi:hypothetical protein [Rhizobium binae]|uniref:hypothetical protein n=1 Tax=Rhizobium binae TaxID=1138190 RepID=UPI001C83EAF4|nr:hypothetical protein [Rhizobium binae]MBX4944611.1 hypothetical protein [Rhizobium binae]MBX4980642.1 hypothetical protein [Rhizobium binae]